MKPELLRYDVPVTARELIASMITVNAILSDRCSNPPRTRLDNCTVGGHSVVVTFILTLELALESERLAVTGKGLSTDGCGRGTVGQTEHGLLAWYQRWRVSAACARVEVEAA